MLVKLFGAPVGHLATPVARLQLAPCVVIFVPPIKKPPCGGFYWKPRRPIVEELLAWVEEYPIQWREQRAISRSWQNYVGFRVFPGKNRPSGSERRSAPSKTTFRICAAWISGSLASPKRSGGRSNGHPKIDRLGSGTGGSGGFNRSVTPDHYGCADCAASAFSRSRRRVSGER